MSGIQEAVFNSEQFVYNCLQTLMGRGSYTSRGHRYIKISDFAAYLDLEDVKGQDGVVGSRSPRQERVGCGIGQRLGYQQTCESKT